MRIRYVGQSINNAKNVRHEVPNIPSFTSEQVKNFSPIFRFLNDKDRDILYLIFVTNKKQSAVERILGRSQPSLCYDIKRIRKRLQFIVYLQSVVDIYISFLRDKAFEFYSTEDVAIMTLMFYSTSLTQASRLVGLPQIRLRYKFDKIIKKMEKQQHWDVYEIFSTIRCHLNIIRRIYTTSKPSRPSSLLNKHSKHS